MAEGMTAQVGRLAALSEASGLDGVVASPQRSTSSGAAAGASSSSVTPGIRSATERQGRSEPDDDGGRGARLRRDGYLVVGRPIIGAPDPRAAAEADRGRVSRRAHIGKVPR